MTVAPCRLRPDRTEKRNKKLKNCYEEDIKGPWTGLLKLIKTKKIVISTGY
jgi:hypothetical protein